MTTQISTTAVERLAKTFENHGGAQTVSMHGDTVRLTAATLRALLAERDALSCRLTMIEVQNARHKALLTAIKAWAEGEPSNPPVTGRKKTTLFGGAR